MRSIRLPVVFSKDNLHFNLYMQKISIVRQRSVVGLNIDTKL